MKRHTPLVVLLGLVLLVGQSSAQQAYTLKGFTLGESTLADFKAQKQYGAEFKPFCSDDSPLARLTPDRADSSSSWTQAGFVFCRPYVPLEVSHSGQFFTVADISTTPYFDFFQGKLYRISAAFFNYGGVNFKAMRKALTEKYGAPAKEIPTEYQNPFGAKLAGLMVTWDNGVSTIELTEFNGSRDASLVTFTHKQMAIDAAAAAPKKASKDL